MDTMTTTQTPDHLPALAIPLLSLAAFGSGVSLRVMDPILPLLSNEFHVGLGDASLVITLFSVAYGIAQLFFGPLGDRFGKYLVIAGASLVCAVTALLCGLVSNFSMLLSARLLAGATAAAIIPLSMAWIGDVIPYAQRQPVLAKFLIGQILGLSGGVLLGGFAADAHQWRLPFLLIAAIFICTAAGLFAVNRRLPAHARLTRETEGSALMHILNEFSEIGRLPWARLVLATVFLEGAFLYGPFAFIASHLHQRFGISLTSAGSIIMLFGFGGFAFAMNARRLVQRWGESGLSLRGGIILAAALMTTGLAVQWWYAIPACFMAGLGFYMLHNTLQINATQMAPERRGAAVSAFASSFFLGQSAGVGLAGRLIHYTDTGNIMLYGAAGLIVVSLYFARRLQHKHRHQM
ncbi:MFS transporter [Undibacterium oligocarboniphilum]|uniref:MFS transporter n=2 Tax=Undibacterium oligocarboniphilum TaxID=666702 RepID=A0A850QTH1_9BURK|nr:MFS transporter [Undibacterium oligocarboniphilum]NVO79306.1 MFS transporter [Undibacterium oligocarboniphilum]